MINRLLQMPRLLAVIFFTALQTVSAPGLALDAGCSASARYAFLACEYAVREAYHTRRAQCLNSTGADEEPGECDGQANGILVAGRSDCTSARTTRARSCAAAEDAAYEPEFGSSFASNFINPLQIGAAVPVNSWFPLSQGSSWLYEANYTVEQVQVRETKTVTVTDKTKRIDGISCLVVREVIERDGEVIEDSDRWFAQDIDGKVWNCGAVRKMFVSSIEDLPVEPELIAIAGTYKAGRGSARAGIAMPATPTAGTLLRQQWAATQAEATAEIVAIDATESSPAAACSANCLEATLTSPLTADAQTTIYYAPDIGRIVEIDANNVRYELIEYSVN